MNSPELALALVAAVHLGFQSVVTVVVYPALADVPTGTWTTAHPAHSRRISHLVVPLYLAVLAACAWLLATGPGSVAAWCAVAAQGATLALTAFGAAPLHGRLGTAAPDRRLLTRLLVVDRARLVAAAAGLVAAGLAL